MMMRSGLYCVRTSARDVPVSYTHLVDSEGLAEDIAITGCNNSPDSRICEPELTTLDNKPELLGGMCASLLRDRMEGKESATSVAIQPELVVRGSALFWKIG